jgi:hypothetical protein
MEISKQNLPKVQYALFCRELLQDEEVTFRDVIDKVLVGCPKEITATLVLRLVDVPKGLRNLDINCLVPFTEILRWQCDVAVNKENSCLISQQLRIPIRYSNTYFFTIAFNDSPILNLSLPVHVISHYRAEHISQLLRSFRF